MGYNIEFYAYLPKIWIYIFLPFDLRSDPDPWKKMLDPHPCFIIKCEYSMNIHTYNIIYKVYIRYIMFSKHNNKGMLSNMQKKIVEIYSIKILTLWM